MLRLPLIRKLDLRPPVADPDEWVWDWPELPTFLKRQVNQVHAMLYAMAEIHVRHIIHLSLHGTPPRYRRRPIRSWDWPRIMLALGFVISVGVCALLLLEAAWH